LIYEFVALEIFWINVKLSCKIGMNYRLILPLTPHALRITHYVLKNPPQPVGALLRGEN